MSNFKSYSKYYDLLYETKDYGHEANYVSNILRSFNKKISSILELGSGTGNHAQYLCNQGLEVYGIEKSKDMIQVAKNKKIQNYHPQVGDISCFQSHHKFDAAISLFHVISYLTNNKELINCFKCTRDHLNDNGIFLFDAWHTPAVYLQKPETRIKRLQSEELEIIRLAEPEVHYNSNTVDVNYEIIIEEKQSHQYSIVTEKHSMRHFSIPEVEMLATFTGFELIKTEEFLTGKQPSDQTWSVCFILKKRNA